MGSVVSNAGMMAMVFYVVPRSGHLRMSMANARRRNSAHGSTGCPWLASDSRLLAALPMLGDIACDADWRMSGANCGGSCRKVGWGMSIEADLKAGQIAAMKAKDSATANVIKMIRTKVTEKRTAKGFSGEVNDELYKQVIAAYKKSLEKARVEFVKAGEKGVDSVASLDHEIAFCQTFLPQPMGEDEVRAAAKAVIGAMGEVSPKMAGRIVGAVMKEHKGKVEAALVKTVVESLLAE